MAQSEESKARHSAYMKAWRARNRDSIQAYQKAWKDANKEAVKAYQHAYHQSYRQLDAVQQKTRKRHLRESYKLTPEAFNALWERQCGKCLVCAIEMLPRGRHGASVAIDHNHVTGEVRGLLCRKCNHGLGHFNDDPETLDRAAQYLRDKGHYSPLTKIVRQVNE